MKGSVLSGFERFVTEEYGLAQWQSLIDKGASSTEGIYFTTDLYDDNELISLINMLSSDIRVPPHLIQQSFGKFIFPILYTSIKDMVKNINNLFDFLVAVDKVIHIEVQRSDPQAYTPSLYYDLTDENTLLMRYISRRKMCFFAEGLILGAAELYNTQVNISQDCCLNDGHDYCIIRVCK